MTVKLQIGVDLGGTKIAAAALDKKKQIVAERRVNTPRNDYWGTIEAIVELIEQIESLSGANGTIGIGIPGSIHPSTGRVQNANSTWLNGKNLKDDISDRMERPIRMANDANCFAISEAVDGAGAGANSLFGAILGTGCGGAFIKNGDLNDGPLGIGGEWGHTPLPWLKEEEFPGPRCWCGRQGCMEVWVSGPAMEDDHKRKTGNELSCEEICQKAQGGDNDAQATLDRHLDRLARGLAVVVNILDPEVITFGGGLSQLKHLYDELPQKMLPHIFSDAPAVTIRPPVHGDASGVRGAAWLWPVAEER